MKHRSAMLKPASGLCNMRCTYCFYADVASHRQTESYGMMSPDTARRIIDNMLADLSAGDALTLAFQGGEPTLAGLPFFAEVLAYGAEAAGRKGVSLYYALQTNGITLDEDWMPVLRAHKVLVGLSIDGDKSLHDHYRKGGSGEGTFKRVMQSKRLLDSSGVDYNVLVTLTNQSARHPQKLWNFLVKEGIDFVQFTPCLDELEGESRSPYALTPEGFYRFYSALFPLWLARLKQGKYLSVKLFDDMVNYFGRGMPTACGINGKCGVQLVCEGDGSVFPCDFYMLDEFRMGSLADEPPAALWERGTPFVDGGRAFFQQEPCLTCNYRNACGGGCKRMHGAMYVADGLCWWARLLDEILAPLLQIGRQLAGGSPSSTI